MRKIIGRNSFVRRGLIVPLILAAISIFLAVLTIVIDGGIMLLAHSELQGLAEVSALSAASAGANTPIAQKAVASFIKLNGLKGCKTNVMVDGGKVTVLIEREVSLLVSRRVGKKAVFLRGVASAKQQGGQVRLLP